eukprot:78944-Rhodomonas_salina.1
MSSGESLFKSRRSRVAGVRFRVEFAGRGRESRRGSRVWFSGPRVVCKGLFDFKIEGRGVQLRVKVQGRGRKSTGVFRLGAFSGCRSASPSLPPTLSPSESHPLIRTHAPAALRLFFGGERVSMSSFRCCGCKRGGTGKHAVGTQAGAGRKRVFVDRLMVALTVITKVVLWNSLDLDHPTFSRTALRVAQ